MADQNAAAAQGDGRPGTVDPYEQSCFKFEDVLRHELTIAAARRKLLDTERGDLEGTGPPAGADPADAAWQARLLGLSFSGGGIRSATFNLGVLQALAGRGVLRYVDYLSTVSGGGYIGSWLTALCQRRFARTKEDANAAGVETGSLLGLDEAGFQSFEQGLAWSAGDTDGRGPAREDRAIRFLREFSNYLTPKLGMFSGDTWALIAIYVRNALLNQLVLLLALVGVLLLPRLLSPLLGRAEADTDAKFLLWMLADLIVLVFICWNLGRNLASITALRGGEPEHAPRVIRRIGVPLLAIGISAASWLGYVGEWPLTVAAAVGAVVSVFTWSLASASARRHAGKAWSKVEKGFWTRMIWYSVPSGAVFGLLLHAVSVWLFADGTYSGFKLVAAPPALAFAVLLAGVLHVGLAGKSFSAQYTEWLSRFGGIVLIGTIGWLAFNGLVFLGPLLVAWLQGLWEAALSSGWILTTLVSVVFGKDVAASSGRLSRLFMAVAPYIFIVGLGVAAAALLQAGLHEGAVRFGDAVAVENARTVVYSQLQAGGGGLVRSYGEWLAQTEEWFIVAAAIAAAIALTWAVSLRVDVNVFSLNGMYANRLVRCYLGASVTDRKPNRFSGLSARDDLQL